MGTKINLQDIEQFTDQSQIAALKILGTKFKDSAKKFKSDAQVGVLKLLNSERPKQFEDNVKLALKFTLKSQFEALKFLNDKNSDNLEWNIEQAFKFEKDTQSQALKIVGTKNLEFALTENFPTRWPGTEIDSYVELALEILRNSENLKLASKFTERYAVDALKHLGADKAECALKIDDYTKLELLNAVHHEDFDCTIAGDQENTSSEGDL